MRAPHCPDHGRLVLDLALGRLEDGPAAQAERIRGACPVCSAWWQTELEGPAATELDAVLESSFASFAPPARRRVARWLPVAAAATLAAGAGLLWHHEHRVQRAVMTHATQGSAAVETFDGDRDGNGVVDVADTGFTVHVTGAGQAIFNDSLDDGQLTGWTPHT
jgi:hypothetical protein